MAVRDSQRKASTGVHACVIHYPLTHKKLSNIFAPRVLPSNLFLFFRREVVLNVEMCLVGIIVSITHKPKTVQNQNATNSIAMDAHEFPLESCL